MHPGYSYLDPGHLGLGCLVSYHTFDTRNNFLFLYPKYYMDMPKNYATTHVPISHRTINTLLHATRDLANHAKVKSTRFNLSSQR